MILAVCVLTSVWLVMAANAEDKQSKKNQNVQAPSIVPDETKRSANEIKPISYPELTKHELKIQEALNTETDCDFSETPLSKAMELLADRHGITILVMPHHLGEEGLTVNEPVSLSVKGISLKNALDLMLEPNDLTYVVDQDVLKITTRIKAEDELEYMLRVYPVSDFGNTPEGYLELIDMIHKTVLYYDDSISLISSSKSLVVNSSYHNHIAIVELLTQLRRARALD
ncbi:STN domain-containing protein [Gimesia aquarii]|nr:STN domain-containing protein [Gimesia aquarii]